MPTNELQTTLELENKLLAIQTRKVELIPVLQRLKEDKDNKADAFYQAFDEWSKIARLFERLDKAEKQAQNDYDLLIGRKSLKPPAKKKSSKKSNELSPEQKAASLAMKAIENLPPEMQAIILEKLQNTKL